MEKELVTKSLSEQGGTLYPGESISHLPVFCEGEEGSS